MKQTLVRTGVFMVFFLLGLVAVHGQGQKISGTITDDLGETLPGATVKIKGKSLGTITDANGNFSMNADPEDILTISFVGYRPIEVKVGQQSLINVSLELDVTALSEVVVVGYGTTKKSDLISSVASVKPEEMMKIPSTDIGEMLRGKAPGLLITVGNAEPGSSSNFQLRGQRSLQGGNSPIVIADGVIIGSINDVNPNDIASMEILKDAAAQAIYGARAANGVILITTKRGKSGETKLNYNGFYGIQTVQRNFDIYNGEEFAALKREAYRADNPNIALEDINDALIFTPTELEVLQSGEFINWEDELLELASTQQHNLSISSGTQNSQIYSSINLMNQQGVVPGTDFTKVTVRVNADQRINDWLALGVNTSWQVSQKNNPGTGGTLQRTITTSPLGKIYDEEGNLNINPTGVQESFNPLLDLAEVSNLNADRNDIMNLFLDITPFRGFKYRISASRRSWNSKTTNYSTASSLGGRTNGGGQGSIRFRDNTNWMLENIFSYDFQLSGGHNFGITAVQSLNENSYRSFTNTATAVPNDLLGIYGLAAAETNVPVIGGSDWQISSLVARLQYDYAGKYYLTASVRRDGSSKFGANNKWATFPAVAVGWNVHRESFLNQVSAISNLKLRASYGSVGNEGISEYGSQAIADQRDYVVNGQKVSGYVPGGRLANPNLRWETSTTLNAAVDFGLFTNLITGTAEFYNTSTTDLLVDRSLPASIGYPNYFDNIGEIQNRGIELSLNATVVEKKDLVINAGFMFTRNRNEIISLYGVDEDGDGVEDDDVANRWFIGRPISVFYLYKALGIYQYGEDIANTNRPLAQPGDLILYDRDPTDGPLNDDDRVITEQGPEWFGSFNYSMNYKNVDFSFSLYTVQGVVRYNNYLSGYSEGGSLRGIFNGIKQDYWTPENPTADWPRPSEANDRQFIFTKSLQDASYLRLQNVTLGYSLPSSVLSKINFSKIRVYVTGQNLFTQTAYQSYSPERNPNDYPEQVTLIGGIQIGF
ncbi:MAG: TonB-dependent receptor [Cyclobacteriaceae bacterium]